MPMTLLDANQVIKSVYNETTERLKVEAEITASIGDITVDISQSTDSIRIGNGTDLVTTTTVGPKVGLDVNIIGGTITATNNANGNTGAAVPTQATQIGGSDGTNLIAVKVSATGVVSVDGSGTTQPVSAINLDIRDLSQTQDSVKIGDGSDFLAVNTDGTIDIKNITGTVSLPTGASTSANQTSELTKLDTLHSDLVTTNSSLSSISTNLDVALSTRASEATLSSLNGKINDNYGVATGAVRTAAQVGNTTGQADFNSGVVSAQTLRVTQATDVPVTVKQTTADNLNTNSNIQVGDVDVSNANPVPVSDAGGSLTVDGTIAATQSGSWTVAGTGNFTVVQPTGTNLHTVVDSGSITVNNAAGAAAVNIQDGGNSITVDGTITANIGTTGGLALDTTVSGLLTDTELRATPVPISGTVIVTQATGTNLHAVIDSGTITTITNVVHVDDNGGSLTVDGTVAATQSGTWNINNITGTVSLPTGAATSANQSTEITALGTINTTLGTPMQNSGGSVTANIGTTNGLALDATLSAPQGSVSGGAVGTKSELAGLQYNSTPPTLTNAQQAALQGDSSGNLKVNVAAGSLTVSEASIGLNGSPIPTSSNQAGAKDPSGNLQPLKVNASGALLTDSSATTQPISATSLPLPTGASTAANQTTINTSIQALQVAQESTTSGELGPLVQGAVTTTAPTYTTGKTDPLSLTTTGALRVDNSANTQPISGTVTVSNFPTTLDMNFGTVGANTLRTAAEIGNATGAADFNAGATGAQTLRVTANAGTNLNTSLLALESGGNLASIKTNTDNLNLSQASSTSGQKGNLPLTATTTAAPTYTTATSNPFSTTTAGALRVDGSAVTQPISAASLPLPTGAATEATLVKLPLTQGSTTSGQSGVLMQGAVSTASPSYTNGQTSPLSLNVEGRLRTDTTSVGGTTTSTGNGVAGAGVQRVAIASDNTPIHIIVDSMTATARSSTATLTNVTSSATSVTLLASNAARNSATIYNDSTKILYVKFGATASTTSFTVQMSPESYYEVPQPVYTGIIDGIWEAANGAARVTEMT